MSVATYANAALAARAADRFHSRRAADPGQQLLSLPRAGSGERARPICGSTCGRPAATFTAPRAVIAPASPTRASWSAAITSDDPDVHMPPADSGKTLTPEQIEMLRTLGRARAPRYKKHWAFVPPQRGRACRAVKNQGLGPQSDRCLCAGAVGARGTGAVAAGRPRTRCCAGCRSI